MANIRKTIKDMTNVQFMKYKVAAQKGRMTKLKNEFRKLQHLVRDNILSLTDSSSTYSGNTYRTYDMAVSAIDEKYNGTAEWGVLQTGTIIDLRSAFIIGDGITVSAKEGEAEKEIEWAEQFLEYNDLDQEVSQEFAKEAEIEGKIALKLALEPDKDDKENKEKFMVSVRFISWAEKKYKVETNPKDYLDYQKLEWKETGQYKAETLNAKEFVYKKFGGRIMNPNEAAPKIMKCLTQIDSLDKALRDWRQINHMFAGPILYAKCEDKREVTDTLAALNDKNFKINKVLAGTAEVGFIELNVGGIDSIEREIADLAKVISGNTGIPVHFLGFVDLMSNRSTAETLIEMINAGTTKERSTWIGAYEEVIRKAMTMWNESTMPGMSKGAKLDPDKIQVDIPVITKEHYDRLEKIFLPAWMAGKLTDEAFYTMLPGFDMKAELARKKKKEESELEQTKRDLQDQQDRDVERDLIKTGGRGE